MPQSSTSGGRHDSKVADRLDAQNSNAKSHGSPSEANSESQQHQRNGGASGNTDSPRNREQRPDSMNNGDRREDIAASNRFMPQSGKPAGIYNTQEEKDDQHREDIAASNRFMPQAGKPTGTSSL
ncbi:hypothetical protein N7509_001743 [Penicillium cosmopolitanum]|uniref:Uncharacterized protein n=1 Tax=Penicillium cosmopolitanum TaxID=1131564 RepID=A0A9W9W826_9EURO|nr:uncharacterized protein N7509_001743 [Penicillium cosmopolitanum]KAJ5407860.1 hypothetical protein N7509_001743 [Penicillium cosmopolitanum]